LYVLNHLTGRLKFRINAVQFNAIYDLFCIRENVGYNILCYQSTFTKGVNWE
jgi:hypothetical protein